MKMKKCVICGEEFYPTCNRQKYCCECKKIILKEQVKKALIKYYIKMNLNE